MEGLERLKLVVLVYVYGLLLSPKLKLSSHPPSPDQRIRLIAVSIFSGCLPGGLVFRFCSCHVPTATIVEIIEARNPASPKLNCIPSLSDSDRELIGGIRNAVLNDISRFP
jgi:hypothetical protein